MAAALTVAALLVHLGIDNPAALEVAAAHRTRAAALVAQLGDRQFIVRDAAQRELDGMGRLALPAVRDGLGSADAEVRLRCGRLAPAMEAEELAARLAVFVADAAGRYEHRVPGWELFRAAAGGDKSARDLFAEITRDRANWPLLSALRGPGVEVRSGLLAAGGGIGAWADRPPPARAAHAAAVRRWEFFTAREAPPELDDDATPPPKKPNPGQPEIALLMLAETLHSERLRVGRAARNEIDVNSLLNQTAGRDGLEGKGRFGPSFARLCQVWFDTRDGAGALTAYNLANHLKYDPAVVRRYAVRVLRLRELTQPNVRVECLLLLTKANTVEHLGAVVGSFGDEDIVGPSQVRDFALAFAITLTGQRLDDYGMATGDLAGLFVPPPDTKPKDMGDVVARMRQAAFARWRDWEVDRFGAVAGPAAVAAARRGS